MIVGGGLACLALMDGLVGGRQHQRRLGDTILLILYYIVVYACKVVRGRMNEDSNSNYKKQVILVFRLFGEKSQKRWIHLYFSLCEIIFTYLPERCVSNMFIRRWFISGFPSFSRLGGVGGWIMLLHLQTLHDFSLPL